MVKPFLHKMTIAKVCFLKDKDVAEKLLELVPEDQLPVEYGGTNTEFEVLYP